MGVGKLSLIWEASTVELVEDERVEEEDENKERGFRGSEEERK
jgi:hypothetical protein